ncbi:DUF4384 domain-containing protein [Candidatus Contendibacter odensensis]|uniref:DUF4384 domain-containing protein n=1 Tax=Candidatus Contendobacter odensis Run_B_J11 TaxID=1400861 RepID=A0A7U7GAK3_9GAMM|nr:DUF4384 domain-containing protein [Candidatus Contendobacter odensis]CDH44615.1 exported hypothetical protein [Candidatus Contendobacter odensis Run_B_J11]
MSRIGLSVVFSMIIMALLMGGCATPPTSPAVAVNDPLRLGNPKAAFVVTIQTDHQPLRIGNSPQLSLRTTANGYMNLYFINPSEKTGQLLTNYPVQANETIAFPPTASKKLLYALTPPTGTETFILVITHQPLNLLSRRDISNVKKPRTAIAEFNLSGSQLINRLREALRRWPPAAWNADSVQLPLIAPGVRS